jgi:CHASE3 domain.
MSSSAPQRRRLLDFLEAGFLRELGLPTLVVSLVLFVSAMTLLGANVSELRRSYARMQQYNETLIELEAVDNDILRVEMTVRGYILSGDPIFLTWKQMGSARLADRLSAITASFSGDPVQRANAEKLKKLLSEHGALFDNLAKRAANDRDQVVGEIVAYGRRVGRRDIENMVVTMRTRAMKELAEEQLKAETRVVNAYRYAIGMSSAALILAGIGFGLLMHDRKLARR